MFGVQKTVGKTKFRCNFNYFSLMISFEGSYLFQMAGMGHDDTVNGTMVAKVSKTGIRLFETYLSYR